jgi:hypothetical protein
MDPPHRVTSAPEGLDSLVRLLPLLAADDVRCIFNGYLQVHHSSNPCAGGHHGEAQKCGPFGSD